VRVDPPTVAKSHHSLAIDEFAYGGDAPEPNSGRVRYRKKPQQRDTFLTEAAQASWVNADGCYSHSERRLSPKTMRFKTGLAKGYAMVDFHDAFSCHFIESRRRLVRGADR
jgi:hypothetical protein